MPVTVKWPPGCICQRTKNNTHTTAHTETDATSGSCRFGRGYDMSFKWFKHENFKIMNIFWNTFKIG